MTTSNAIEKTVERNLKTILDNALILDKNAAQLTTYVGRQDGDFTCPSVTILAIPVPEADLFGAIASNLPGGYYNVAVVVTINTDHHDDKTANEYHSILSQVRDAILNTDIIDNLNAYSTTATYIALFDGAPTIPTNTDLREYDLAYTFLMAPTADATPATQWRGIIDPNAATDWDTVIQAAYTTSTTTTGA